MKNKIAKVIAIISIIMCICILGNTSGAVETYSYKNRNYILRVKPGSTISELINSRLGTYENFKSFGIITDFTQALDSEIYKEFKEKSGAEFESPWEVLKTNDKFIDKNGNEYVLGLLGDLNFDGKVSIIDCMLLKRWLLGMDVDLSDSIIGTVINIQDSESDAAKMFIKAADFTGDDNIRTNDLIYMKRYLVSEGIDISEVDGDLDFDGICDINDYKVMLDVIKGKYELNDDQKENSKYFEGMSEENLIEYINNHIE